ncbi:hypothetical protein BHE90_001712 [Fusarium euwallaceae]|uniref:Uncharacterized protein n=1 Tax=Fusarium euwallaceae TaxID=1147111 RepID=A0A430M708_9HYPO|nr:hypothetical protein BHE90_001712 [Fusarium euwallaceae]
MNYSLLYRREAGSGLGLGWILAFSVGGAILLFAAIGFLLTWRIRSRTEPESTTVYQVSDNSDDHRRSIFTKRLVKKNYSMSKSGSRLSLSLPPVLPPLPSHNSFTFFSGNGKRGRSSSWVEEDKFHGPKVSRSRRDSLFSRDSWLGRAPTLPSLMLDDDLEKGQPSELPADQPTTHLMDQQSLETLKPSKTAPELPTPPQELQTSPVRIPPLANVRASVTDLDLRDILRCTEQRLRDGSSQSPTKTPRPSPSKRSQKISSLRGTPHRNSPLKTPHSHRTTSSLDSSNTTGTVRINRIAQSPSKRSTIHGMPRPGHSRTVSISSIGSAANSLIAEATQELGLPGGLSSPSRLRGRQWQPLDGNSPEKEPTPKKTIEKDSPDRRESQDSEASSSLSTLYSANEPEDKDQPDPFVEKKRHAPLTSESRSSLFGPRSLRSRTRTLSISIPAGQTVFNTQGQLNSNSVSTQAVGGPPLSIVLQPPQEYLHRDISFGSRDRHGFALAYPVTGSMTSMVTPSVTDEDSSLHLDDRRSESPRLDVPGRPIWPPQQQDRNTLVVNAPTSPMTTASSPFDEQDMMALLMGTAAPRRALPDPPRHVAQVEQIVMPTPLCPRPRRDFSQHLHQMSMASPESSGNEGESIVDDPAAVSTGSPLRRSLSRSLRDPPSGPPPAMMSMSSLGNSIVELRRMNSMVSSYSATSMASSYNEPDSPTLPNPLNSTFSRGRLTSNPRTSTSGRQNYLNLGSPRKSLSGAVSAATPTRPIPPSKSSRSNLGVEIREDEDDAGKENQGPELKVPRLDVATGLRETRRSGNLGRDTRDSILTTRVTGNKTKIGALSKKEAQRQSVESLGLYDKDGFLKASPENKGRCLRM